jgi:hypothetical protein
MHPKLKHKQFGKTVSELSLVIDKGKGFEVSAARISFLGRGAFYKLIGITFSTIGNKVSKVEF